MKRFFKLSYVLIISLSLAGFLACDGGSGGGGGGDDPPPTISVTSFALDETPLNEFNALNMYPGESDSLTVLISPYNATDTDVVWSTLDESIVTLEPDPANPHICNVSTSESVEGSTRIYVQSVDGLWQDWCHVNVVKEYSLTVYNRTGGMLNVRREGSSVQREIGMDDSTVFTIIGDKPSSITLYKESVSDLTYGYEFDDDVIHYTGHGIAGSLELTLPSAYFALWVRNNSSTEIDFIGYNDTGTYAYEEGSYYDPKITNDGYNHFIGFLSTYYDEIYLWDDFDDSYDGSFGETGDSLWDCSDAVIQTNDYGSKFVILQAD